MSEKYNKNNPSILKALLRKIGPMAAVDFFISCLPGIISPTLSGIYLVSGIFDLILKLQNHTSEIIVDTIYGTGKQGWLVWLTPLSRPK